MFVLDHIGKVYLDGETERWILRDLSLDTSVTRFLGIEGPSGSGKTTLLSMLCGLVTADEGTLTFENNDGPFEFASASQKELRLFRRNCIGFIYQFFNLLPTLTAAENVLLPLELTRQPELQKKALARLDMLGLDNRHGAYPNELSGGEQQRLAVARAFAHEPNVILADEPTGNLDRSTASQVINLLWEEAARNNALVIVASHDPAVIERCDEVVALTL